MKKRLLSMMICLALCLAYLPVPAVLAGGNTYYVSESGSDSNAGTTSASPLQTLNQAVKKAAAGDTVVVLSGGAQAVDETNNDAPLLIDKALTICGEGSALPTLTLRCGGILLGADVTFAQLKIGTAGFLRPGIGANGHRLTLRNVHEDASLRPLQIYGGTFYDYSASGNGLDFGEAYRTENGKSTVNIIGGSYAAIYAGSINGSFPLPVEINVHKADPADSSATYGLSLESGIFAASTAKNPNDTAMAGKIPAIDSAITLPCSVSVSVNDNAPVKQVSGMTEENTVSLTAEGVGTYIFAVDHIDDLTVKGGTFQPSGSGDFSSIILTGTEANKATLDLSQWSDPNICVQDFTGSANAILVLASDGDMTVEGSLSGGPTEFRTGGGMPWNSAQLPGYSGVMTDGATYIKSGSGAVDGGGSFVIRNPNGAQPDIRFTDTSSMANGWTMTLDAETDIGLTEFSLTDTLVTVIDPLEVELNASVSFPEDSDVYHLGSVPMAYTVAYTPRGSAAASTYTSEDFVYWWECEALAMEFFGTSSYEDDWDMVGTHQIYIASMSGEPIVPGTYQITVEAMTTAGLVTDSVTLEVRSEQEGESASATVVLTALPGNTAVYGHEQALEIKVMEEGTGNPLEEGSLQFYVNGRAWGAPIPVSEKDWKIPVTTANGFAIGSNTLTAEYLGTDLYAPAAAAAEVTVIQAKSTVSAAGENVTVTYDGLNHPFVPDTVTVKAAETGEDITLKPNAQAGTDYEILYRIGEQEVEEPCLAGSYDVYIRSTGNDYWTAGEPVKVGTVTILPAPSAVTAVFNRINYAQTKSGGITASGVICGSVTGEQRGIIPSGKLCLYSESDQLLGQAPLSGGQAEIRFTDLDAKTDFTRLRVQYIPDANAPYLESGGNVTGAYSVSVDAGTGCLVNGIAMTDTPYFAAGQEVTVSAGTYDGRDFEGWNFSTEDGFAVPEIEAPTAVFTFTMPEGNVRMTARWSAPMGNPFTDVAEDAYYYEAVLWAVKMGITKGTAEGIFSPDAPCTRAQMATFLWRAAASPDPAGTGALFTDTPADAYYATAVLWAVEKGITVGTGVGIFSPDADCTRAQMATFLWRNEGMPAPEGSTVIFTDVTADAYYAQAVQWAFEQGITLGTGDGTTFSPDAPCTRSQMVTFLYRCLN